MSASRRLNQHPTTLRLAVWLLLVVLAVQGCAGVLVQVLGPAHLHRQAAGVGPVAARNEPSRSLIGDFLAWRQTRAQQLQAQGLFRTKAMEAPAHSHDGLQRHHHDRGDDSVLALDSAAAHGDATGDGGQQVSTGSWTLPWAPALEHPGLRAADATAAWHPSLPARWSSAWARLPERPPRA